MAFVGSSLAAGQVATSWATIYTSTGAKTVMKSADFLNIHALTQIVEVRVVFSGGSGREVGRAKLEVDEKYALLSEGEVLVMSSGDTIEAQTTTASAVDFTLTGATE
ncbi:MAG: hypothetical protein V3W44_09000 [Dehalococcoidales bacterium]